MPGQQVEVHRDPDSAACRHRSITVHRRGDGLDLVAFPDVAIAIDDPLPVLAR